MTKLMGKIVRKSFVLLVLTSVVTVSLNFAAGSASAAPNSVAEMLATLDVSPEVSQSQYSRTQFKHWIDANKNGCDTRAEVLISESKKKVTKKGKCTIVKGSWLSLYDNEVITDASKLDVDHLVPLAEAWRSGASYWTASVKQLFANDLGVSYALVAVSASSNRSKGDRDPANWVPSNQEVVCNYVGSWIAMKYRWSLSVDEAEQNYLESRLSSCGAEANVTVPSVRLIFSAPETTATPKPKASPTASSKVFQITVKAPTEAQTGSQIDVSVRATDINGKPVAGIPITYSDSSGFLSGEGPNTNSDGTSIFSITLIPTVKYVTAIIFKGGQMLGSHVVWIKDAPVTPAPIPTYATPTPSPTSTPLTPALDPRFSTCYAANAAGYGPYYRSADSEYYWYSDRDKDGIVCER